MRSYALLLHTMLMVNSVNCDSWERIDATRWRAEGFAKVEVDGGYLPVWREDVTADSAPDLFVSLELFCRMDIDGGVDY